MRKKRNTRFSWFWYIFWLSNNKDDHVLQQEEDHTDDISNFCFCEESGDK